MDLRRVVSVLGRRLRFVAVTAIIAAAAAYVSAPHAVVYRARATVFMGEGALAYDPTTGQQNPLSVQIGELNNYTFGSLVSAPATARFAVAIAGVPRSPLVAAAETSGAPVLYTELFTVTVVDPDPRVAAALANAAPEALNDELNRLAPAALGQAPPAPAVLYVPAEPPTSPVRSPAGGDALLAIPFGILVAVGAAIIAELLQPTVAAAGQAEALLGVPVLGSTRRRRKWALHRRPLVVAPALPSSGGRKARS
ncbi:MAG TPA: hypothetical protein VGI06_02095 [Acidimicrobiales bacterium]